ncbi:hypothetical protein JOC75_000559 [Metabacillus crassostreae]|uniref:hypothetical protein n=1 Tax=Metabacillus crassostreae TaxID=929098 RepID=UPI00195976AB|nr:hypothetical protein [Metabacillus crassostreae]MBM7602589.1 hypothetical protein [Metabacillus crassostreae]
MKDKPRSKEVMDNSYLDMCKRKMNEFINDERTEEDYIRVHEDSLGRNTLAWPELLDVRKDMDIYREFLLKLSMENRRLVLLNEEVISFSQRELYYNYGISFNPLRRYFGSKKSVSKPVISPPNIRKIITSGALDRQFIAFAALLARVPIDWLEREKPSKKWSVEYFDFLPSPRMNEKEFLSLINSVKGNLHDVRGIIIENKEIGDIYIRLELIDGGFIIEILNKNSPFQYVSYALNLLKDFNIHFGSMQTVISSQVNFICFSKSLKNIDFPEFTPVQL